MKGAQPSDTARAILSYKGVMMKKHLLEGVKKGAHTEEQVEDKFNAWLADKDGRISTKAEGLSKADAEAREKALAAEKETNQNRAEAIAAKNAPVVEEAPAEEATEEAPAAESTEETAE